MARYEARVEVGTATLEREIGTGSLEPLTLHGHTRDLSPSGLGIIIPSVDTGPRHTGGHLPARVKVEFAERGVEVKAEAVHWTPLGEVGLGRGVLIGMRVTGGGGGRQRQYIWRRAAPRMEVPLPAFWGPAEDDCAGVAIARGLSRRGCFVEALVDELQAEMIFLRVLLPTGKRLALRAEVAYYVKGRGIGAAFTGVSAEDAEMIDLLAEYYAEE